KRGRHRSASSGARDGRWRAARRSGAARLSAEVRAAVLRRDRDVPADRAVGAAGLLAVCRRQRRGSEPALGAALTRPLREGEGTSRSGLLDAGDVLARLARGAGDDIGAQAALLGQDQQAAEQSATLGVERGRLSHDRAALLGSQRTKGLL